MNVLCILMRTPRSGHGKTRLRAHLGDALVDAFVRASVADTLDWVNPGVDHLVVAFDGDAGDLTGLLPPRCSLTAQPEADFGARLTAALDCAFTKGASRAVIVGTDCPTLPGPLLARAFDELERHPATLIPARDGGWIALGVRHPVGDVLRGVTWSSSTTLTETVAALERDGRLPILLDSWYDVDEPQDLTALAAERLSPAAVARAPRTTACIRACVNR